MCEKQSSKERLIKAISVLKEDQCVVLERFILELVKYYRNQEREVLIDGEDS